VDFEELRALTDGDAEFERELVDVFVASGDRALAAIVAALAADDLDAVRSQAHALKGASSNLRAKPLAATAARLEAAARARDAAMCREAARELEEGYRATTAFLASR
jgi:HPt (histidine-containing phosphotransfer) domain-containing protein